MNSKEEMADSKENNRSNQKNPNHYAYWTSRGYSDRPKDWQTIASGQNKPANDKYGSSSSSSSSNKYGSSSSSYSSNKYGGSGSNDKYSNNNGRK